MSVKEGCQHKEWQRCFQPLSAGVMSNYCSVWGRRLTLSSAHKHQVMALCNGPIVSCHGSQSASESSGPSGGEGHFTLNIHVVLLVIIGWRILRQWIANMIMNKPPLYTFLSTLQTSSVLFFQHCVCELFSSVLYLLWLWPAGGTRYLTITNLSHKIVVKMLHWNISVQGIYIIFSTVDCNWSL